MLPLSSLSFSNGSTAMDLPGDDAVDAGSLSGTNRSASSSTTATLKHHHDRQVELAMARAHCGFARSEIASEFQPFGCQLRRKKPRSFKRMNLV